MKLYLMRHGQALDSNLDQARGLSPFGIEQVKAVGRMLALRGTSLTYIFHSNKTRAEQTAAWIAGFIESDNAPQYMDGLDPEDSIDETVLTIKNLNHNTLIVGHLPYLSILASYLLSNHTEDVSLEFQTGSIACFSRGHTRGWVLEWLVDPLLLMH